MRYFFLIILIVFLGCNGKQNSGYFAPTKFEQQSLINTKKDEFTINQTRYLVLGTYISPIIHPRTTKDKDEFLVGIYNDSATEKSVFFSNVSLNQNIKNITIKKIQKDDNITKLSPMYNAWTEYFLISSPPIKSTILTLSFEINHSREVFLVFPKEL